MQDDYRICTKRSMQYCPRSFVYKNAKLRNAGGRVSFKSLIFETCLWTTSWSTGWSLLWLQRWNAAKFGSRYAPRSLAGVATASAGKCADLARLALSCAAVVPGTSKTSGQGRAE